MDGEQSSRHGWAPGIGAIFLAALILMATWSPAVAQTTAAAQPSSGMIRLTFPDNIEIKLLAEYVSQRLGLNILYDEQIGAKKITIRAANEIPKDSLLTLFQSALKMKGLVLVDADQPGWKRIVPSQDLITVTRQIRDGTTSAPADRPMEAITQVIRLKNITPQVAEQVIKPFLTQPGANSFIIPDQSLIIVTDYSYNFSRLMELVRLADQSGPAVSVEFVTAQHMEAGRLAQDVTKLLGEKTRASGDKHPSLGTIMSLGRNNQIVLIGTGQQLKDAQELIDALDVQTDVTTKVYQFQSVSPERVERLAKELIDPDVARSSYRATVDKEAGLLIVSGPPAVHEKIAQLKKELDVGVEKQANPVRFYRLMNTTAADVLATIQSMQKGKEGTLPIPAAIEGANVPLGVMPPPPGANLPPGDAGQQPPKPPIYHDESSSQPSGPEVPAVTAAPRTIQTEEAIITSDPNTNSIIVVAAPAVQRTYELLIKELDKRRPQVLLEVTLITLDLSKDISLGVEMASAGGGNPKYLTFSSFGLSGVDVDNGALNITPGTGFNGSLVSPDVISVIVRALQNCGKADVISAPRILVNDNGTGTLASIAEAPFTSVNASNTVATTSFAGYASAGTTITLTPHIGEGDHLQLKYSITLNSFTGAGSAGVPPPRQTNTITSEVTVPDGYAVIVGGLKRLDSSTTSASVPILGDIPFVKYLFGSNTKSESEKRFFAFVRPIILRDDNFEDLKYFSEMDLAKAGLKGNLPESEPIPSD